MPKSEGCGTKIAFGNMFIICGKTTKLGLHLCSECQYPALKLSENDKKILECQSQQEQENKVGLATGDSANLIPAGADTLKSKMLIDGTIPYVCVKKFIRHVKSRIPTCFEKVIDEESGFGE